MPRAPHSRVDQAILADESNDGTRLRRPQLTISGFRPGPVLGIACPARTQRSRRGVVEVLGGRSPRRAQAGRRSSGRIPRHKRTLPIIRRVPTPDDAGCCVPRPPVGRNRIRKKCRRTRAVTLGLHRPDAKQLNGKLDSPIVRPTGDPARLGRIASVIWAVSPGIRRPIVCGGPLSTARAELRTARQPVGRQARGVLDREGQNVGLPAGTRSGRLPVTRIRGRRRSDAKATRTRPPLSPGRRTRAPPDSQ
jgi:hypothetical protein